VVFAFASFAFNFAAFGFAFALDLAFRCVLGDGIEDPVVLVVVLGSGKVHVSNSTRRKRNQIVLKV
jgi:hypothetical protein